VRDYYKYFIAYETYDPLVLPDTPQWNAFATSIEAFDNGMTPVFGGNITVTEAWLRTTPQDEFVAFVNATRTLGLFANTFDPSVEGGGFWYFQNNLRRIGYNSLNEKPRTRRQSRRR
jgi:hypothetical protein